MRQPGGKICHHGAPYSDISAQVQSLNHSILLQHHSVQPADSGLPSVIVSLAITAPVKKLIEAMREVQQEILITA